MFKRNTFLKNIEKVKLKLSDYSRALEILDEMKQNIDRPLRLAIVGEYNAGKSTFINAILGENILPSSNQPTTAQATYIQYSPVRGMYITYKDGRHEARALDDLFYFQHRAKSSKQNSQIKKADEVELENIERIDLMINNEFLDNLVLIDTPGFNAPHHDSNGQNIDEETTKKLLEEADAIIWLASATQVGSSTQLKKIEENAKRYKGRALLIISKIDQIDPDEDSVDDLIRRAQKVFKDNFIDYIAISAKDAIPTKNKPADPRFIQVFFNAFYLHIKPMMKEWVIISLEKELLEFLGLVIDLKTDAIEELDDLQKDLEVLYIELEKIRKGYMQKMRNIFSSMQNQIDKMIQNTANQMRNNMDYWEDQEPYQRREEGFFTDDYYIDYRTVYFYKYTDHIVEKIDENLRNDFDKHENDFSTKLKECFEEYHKLVQDHINIFGTNHEDVLDSHGLNVSDNDTYYFNPSDDMNTIDNNQNYIDGYFHSGLRFGGSYAMNLHSIHMRLSSKPSHANVIEDINYFFPLTSLKDIFSRFQNLLEEDSKHNLMCNIDFFRSYLPTRSNHLKEEVVLFDTCIKDLY